MVTESGVLKGNNILNFALRFEPVPLAVTLNSFVKVEYFPDFLKSHKITTAIHFLQTGLGNIVFLMLISFISTYVLDIVVYL